MIKAKEITMKNIVIYLAAAMALSAVYFISRPQVVSNRTMPVFMLDEVVVQNTVRPLTAVKADKIVVAKSAEKANIAPVLPTAAVPLAIIPPVVSFKVLPVYPPSALENNLTGTVLLAVYVGLKGQPEKIETKTSSGIAELDGSARAAVAQWKFSPALQGSVALASWFEVPVRFEIN